MSDAIGTTSEVGTDSLHYDTIDTGSHLIRVKTWKASPRARSTDFEITLDGNTLEKGRLTGGVAKETLTIERSRL